MPSIQISKIGVFSVNLPVRLARSLKLQKGELVTAKKGKNNNEIVITVLRE